MNASRPSLVTPEAVLNLLKAKHRGRSNGITAKALVQAITQDQSRRQSEDRHLRAAILELRLGGHPICGKPKTGYFYAQTPAEIRETCQHLRDRVSTSMKQVHALEKAQISQSSSQQSLLI